MKKRIFIIALICLAIAGYFWTQSRYPALNQKALMAETLHTDRLSFGTKYDISADDSFSKRVFLGTVNWSFTNKQGMTFGVIFAGAFLTLLQFLPQHKKKNGFLNSAKGMITGTPLGVCANCVAPIGQSMYDSGSRIETVLATMVSSPTLNVIVLTMVFSLFPFSFALIKVVSTLILILVIIPLMTRWFFKKENDRERKGELDHTYDEEKNISEGWVKAFIETVRAFGKNFWYIFYTTVPLMLVAGFLGILLLEFIPLDTFTSLQESPATFLLIAFVAAVIPAPITFDVIVALALRTAGLSSGLTMTFLIAAGTYSIYPALILSRSISKKVALSLFAAVMLVSIGAGVVVSLYDDYRVEKSLDIFDEYFQA